MSREKDLVRNTAILSIGKFLPKGISIITLPIITAQLTKAEYGTYDLIATLVMLLLPVATLQIQSAAFRFLIECRNDKAASGKIITNIFVVTIPISVFVSFLLVLLWSDLEPMIRLVVGLYLIADILYLTISQVTRGLSFNKVFSESSILLSAVNCIAIVITLKVHNYGLIGAVFSLFIANMIAAIYLTYKIHLFSFFDSKYISKETIKELIQYSWPMVPNNLSNWILKLSDRLIITAFLGIEANAVYAVANKIPNLLSIAQSIFVMAWQENASIVVRDKDAGEYYSKMFDKILTIMFSCTALLVGFTPVIFKLLIRGSYEEAYVQMPILILGMFFYCMSAFQGGIYVAHKRTKSVGITTIAAAVVNLVIDIAFVKSWGITAGSVSTLVAYLLLYVFRMVDSLRFQPMDYHIKKQTCMLFIIVLMLILCFMQNFYFNIINIVLGISLFFLFNKELILKTIHMASHILNKN